MQTLTTMLDHTIMTLNRMYETCMEEPADEYETKTSGAGSHFEPVLVHSKVQ